MKLEVKLISEECIKPSSPTPPHLKTYKISYLDQFMGHTDVPMIIFYSNQDTDLANNDDIINKRSQLLKQSLSETLTHFYPLAGKIKDNLSVECNDEGAYYVEARANIPLSEYLTQPESTSMNFLLLPRVQSTEYNCKIEGSGYFLTMIQETTFACGSIAVGMFVSHMIMDATALASFVKAWAATASRKETMISLNLDAPSIFPQYDPYPINATNLAIIEPVPRIRKPATVRLVFDASAIASLKARATSSSVQNPTRAEAVSAFLGERIMAVLKERSSIKRKTILTHAVNLRRSVLPPFPESSLGNFVWLAPAVITSPMEAELPSIVCKMREAIRKIDSNFVKSIQGDGGFFKFYENIKEMRKVFSSEVDSVSITNICNLGLYDVDFGWGRPMWVSFVGFPDDPTILMQFRNTLLLTDASKHKGIEAWLFLEAEDLAMLEKDKELLAYASLNPCRFNLGCTETEHMTPYGDTLISKL